MAGLATACDEVQNLVRVEFLENKFLSRTIISFDAKSDLCVGSVRLVHFETDERAPEFLFGDTRGRRLLWWCSQVCNSRVAIGQNYRHRIFRRLRVCCKGGWHDWRESAKVVLGRIWAGWWEAY